MTRSNSPLVELEKSTQKAPKKGKETRRARKRDKVRLSKEQRLTRNAKGWMDGIRERCMLPLVSEYADARLSGGKVEQMKMREILNKFHFWFPYPMKDHEEPTEVPPYDPHYVAPEGDEAFEAAKGAHLQKYGKRVKAWIMSRLERVAGGAAVKKVAQTDPFNVLMCRLAGVDKPPRAHSALQQWQSENWATGAKVEAVVLKEWNEETGHLIQPGVMDVEREELAEEGDDDTRPSTSNLDSAPTSQYPTIKFITAVATRMFQTLPEEEQAAWKHDAQEEARAAKEEYKERLANPVEMHNSTTRAAAVRNAPKFLSKINRGIELASALRLTTLATGPMARKKGEVGFFMVTTSTNRAAVPMSFQEWYGEKRTKELMDAYKEWVESCLSPEEARDLAQEVDMSKTYASSNSLGKGFTTDDVVGTSVAVGAPSHPAVGVPRAENITKGPYKNRSQPATKPKALRKKAGEEVPSDTSSSNEEDEWSARSSSEDSAGPRDSSEGDSGDDDLPLNLIKRKRKALRDERREKRRRKEERRLEKPSHRSTRKKVADDQAMEVDGESVVEGGVGVTDGSKEPGSGTGDVEMDAHPAPNDEEVRQAARAGLVGAGSGVPGRANDDEATQDGVALPPPVLEDAAGDQEVSTEVPPTSSDDDNAARDLLAGLSPEARMGLEDGVLKIAPGLGSLAGLLKSGGRGLMFLVLPFNEFLQAKGGSRLKGAMEMLIAIELHLANGPVRDGNGRKKAVIPVSSRPQLLSVWIGKGRCRLGKTGAAMARLVIKAGSLESFVKGWKIWWSELQPEWRVRLGDDCWERKTYGEDWHDWIVPGQNGLLSLIATLSWWGASAMLESEEEGWAEAVTDVEWMLTGLLASLRKE